MDKYAIVIAGPSGAGKTTVADRLIASLGTLEMSRSATTRAKRGDGRDDEYIYVGIDEFKDAIENGDVLEFTEYSENFYGTRKCELERIWNMEKNPILVLDYNGARSLKERLDIPVYAIYVYTSLKEAEKRLFMRDLNGGATEKKMQTVKRRIKENVSDYKKLHTMASLFDLYVENSDLDTCVKAIEDAIFELSRGGEAMLLNDKEKITSVFKSEAENFKTDIE